MSGNNQITQTISPFIQSQVPEFLRAGSPAFVAFIKAYYEWLEQGNTAITTDSFQLLSYKDVDQTTSQFIQFFINDFLPLFPNNVALNEKKLIKQARNFYQKKGSVESIQFLFRVLYNKEADIYFPKNNILKCSAGKWVQPQALDLLATNLGGFNVAQLIGHQGVGSQSNATCTIESAAVTLDPGLGIEIVEIFISNIVGAFSDLENLNITYGFDSNGNPLVFSEKIIASISNVVIDPNNRGLSYRGFTGTYPGDPVVFVGGLQANDSLATPAIAFVNSVTSGSITGVVIEYGGYNYRVNPNTEVTVVRGPGDTTGVGGNVQVTAIDTGNSIFSLIQIDAISFKSQTALNSANYAFANTALANINTKLGTAFSYANLQFGPISAMNVTAGGANYTATPNLTEAVTYYTDLTNFFLSIPDLPDAANTVQFMKDLGWIANVNVVSGGSNYNTTTDVVVVPSSIGYGATFTFTTNATGTITGVNVTNPGNGYFYLPYGLVMANSANTQNAANGSGALLTAYGYGEGAIIEVLVNQIGQILDFRMVSRGFDYVSTPAVSLAVEDLQIVDPGHNLTFTSGTTAFQGANQATASFLANISSYNVASQQLRLYNYQGTFNAAQNLVTTTGNVVANLNNSNYLLIYGNGLAKANAIFLNGLIKFPGFYLDTSGFLSSDQKLQSGDKYHNYSYVVQVEQALNDYKQTLMKLVHPVGMQLLGTFLVQQTDARNLTANAPVQIIPSTNGNINTVSYSTTGGPLNLITFPTDFTNVYWTESNATIILTTNVGPDNIVPVDQISENAGTTNVHSIQRGTGGTGVPIVANGVYTASIYAKANTSNIIYLNLDNGTANGVSNGFFAVFNLAAQTANSGVSGNANVYAATITPVVNGWFQCAVSGNVDTLAIKARYSATMSINTNAQWYPSYAGNTSNSMFIWGAGVYAGNVPPPPYSNAVILQGIGTNFTSNANVGDLIAFDIDNNTRKLQVKQIVAVLNAGNIQVDSNTTWVYPYGVNVSNGSSVITGSLLTGNIYINDIIQMNVANNVQTSIVQSNGATTITVNTVFNANASNLMVLVYPSINTAAYEILKVPV